MPDETEEPQMQSAQLAAKAAMSSSSYDALLRAIDQIVPEKRQEILAAAAYNLQIERREQSGASAEGYFA